MSTLMKLKYDLFLTEERKYYRKLLTSNRCKYCLKVDFSGHFLLCPKSNIKQVCSKLINYCREVNNNISAEEIVHMDFHCSKENIFAIGWCLATITELFFNNEK